VTTEATRPLAPPPHQGIRAAGAATIRFLQTRRRPARIGQPRTERQSAAAGFSSAARYCDGVQPYFSRNRRVKWEMLLKPRL